jgi:methionine-S-sulfoxide reductase
MKSIYLAGGCFWGSEEYFSRLLGVKATEVGYANGNIPNPRYEDLKSGKATHAETVRIVYDEKEITLLELIGHLLRFIDPFAVDHQGGDRGHQYRTGIFYTDPKEKAEIVSFLDEKLGRGYKIVVEPLKNYYPAEEYHQDYLKKNPDGYCHVNLNLIKPGERK